MSQSSEFLSVEQVAERLGLHVRTVRNYVRDGRLKAVRIGKQYRIAREDLDALTGAPSPAPARETVARSRRADVSSVVTIDAIAPEAASRISNAVTGALNVNARDGGTPVRMTAAYYEEYARLKLIFTGDVGATAGLLQLVHFLLDQ